MASLADLLGDPPRVGQCGGSAYKANFCEMYGHMLNFPLILYKSEAYIPQFDMGLIKVLSFLDFVIKLISLADLLPPRVGQFGRSAYKGNFCEIYDHLLKNTPLFLYRFKFSEAYISLNIDLGFIKVLSFLDFVDQTDHLWQIYCPQGLVSLGEVPTKVISVKCMAIYLKIPYYFYTNLNFQRPISHLILIWDPLKFYHFWTLQIKLIILWQIYSPQGLVSLGEVPTKVISVKSMTIYLKIPHYFYTDLNFQRPISHLILIWDSLNVLSFFGLCRSN